MNTIFNLSGKTALIVGASSGIGEQFARCLSKANATVLVSARRKDRLDHLVVELSKNAPAKAYIVDVTDERSITNLVADINNDGYKIDILAIVAGLNIRKPLTDYSLEDWQNVMKVNLDGTWLISQAFAKHMIKQGIAGSIILVSSVLDDRTFIGSSHAYHASKAAVHQLTKSLALELAAYKIRVNCIAPGWFVTDLNRALFEDEEKSKKFIESIPLKRTGNLADLDGVLLLLASNASSYITGSVLRVDGGYATNHISL